MNERIIELSYNRKDFEEIYFRNGGDKSLLHHYFRTELYTTVLSGLVLITSLICFLTLGSNPVLMLFSGILFFSIGIDLYKKALPSFKWKKQVKTYLDEQDKIKMKKLILTQTAFSVVEDSKETIEKWTNFQKAELEHNFVSLVSGNNTYLIPGKSMSEAEFQFLKEIASEQIKKNDRLHLQQVI